MTKAKNLLLEQLIADGNHYLFGNPGTTEQGFMDALQDYPELEFILSLHEGVAVTMANAYARATHRPAFVELHTAPGLGNGIGMMLNAFRGRAPLVVYAGNAEARGLYTEPILGGDLVAIAEPVTKWAVEARNADEVPQLVRRAFKVAAEPPMGPVFISLPLDVMEQETDEPVTPTPFVRTRTRPDPEAVREAAAMLAAARNPVIQVGDEVARSEAHEEVIALAHALGAAICGGGAEVDVPNDEPLWTGRFDVAHHGDADVLLMIGAVETTTLTGAPAPPLPSTMRIIQISPVTWELGKNYRADLTIAADPGAAAADLTEAIRSQQSADQASDARARADRVAEERRAELARQREEDQRYRDQVPISATRLMEEIGGVMPADGAIFNEGITSAASLERYFSPRPGRYFGGGGGGIGPGIPGPLGVKLALPDTTVLGIEGDGSALYTITGLWTAAHHDINVTWVICNNGAYRILKVNTLLHLGEAAAGREFVQLDLQEPRLNFARIAESFGVRGSRVERPEDLGTALREAMAHPGPSLVDVVIDGSVGGRA